MSVSSARPRLPPEVRDNNCASAADNFFSSIKRVSIASRGIGAKRIVWQRERIVGKSAVGFEVVMIRCDVGGGSSRVFSNALAAWSFILSASSTIKTRAAPSNGRKLASRSSSRITFTLMMFLYGRAMATSACSLQISLSLLSSSSLKGGKVDREMRLQDEHSSHASTPTRLRQFIAFASSSANSFLPIPSSPVNSSEPGTRPLTSRCRSDSFTSSLPMSVENIKAKGQGQRAKGKTQRGTVSSLLALCSLRSALRRVVRASLETESQYP